MGDKEQFKATKEAFELLKFTREEQDNVFQLMSAILHMGNIEFEDSFTKSVESSKITTPESLKACASLLQVDLSMLEIVLTTRVLSLASGNVEKQLNRVQACMLHPHTA